MRWNCPHCDTSLQLKVDLDELQRVYAKCGDCSGITLLSLRSASRPNLAPISAQAPLIPIVKSTPTQIEEIVSPIENLSEAPAAPAPMLETVSPPPFKGAFAYSTPPAFLLKAEPIVEVPTYFSTIEDEANENRQTVRAPSTSIAQAIADFDAETENEVEIELSAAPTKPAPRRTPILIATLIALASGGYLVSQIKKILKESESPHVASVEKNHKR